jgi:cytochrome P450
MRKVLTLEFLSTSKLTAYFTVRKEERATLVKNLYVDSSLTSYKKVEMRSKLSELAFNNVMRMATGMRLFGDDVEDLEAAKNFRDIISKIFEITGCNMPNDFFRVLRWIDFQNYEKRMSALHKRSDEFLQSLVDRIRTLRKTDGTKGLRGKTFIDEILDLQEAEPGYYTDDVIKGSIATVLFAGTDSTASTIEWAMSLLLNNPDKLAKARAEIDANVGYDHLVDESEVSKLPYIQAIVSETLRLFPIAPMLAAHVSTEDAVVGGFNIPRGTMVLGNAWAVHRDPNVWEEPSSFKPERFTGAQVETYKFVPFGVGRRQCPGAGMANRMAGHSVAALIQCFEWQRVNEELVDLTEVPGGMTMPKKDRLEAMCKPREEMFDVLSKL